MTAGGRQRSAYGTQAWLLTIAGRLVASHMQRREHCMSRTSKHLHPFIVTNSAGLAFFAHLPENTAA